MATKRTLFDRMLAAQKRIGVISKDKTNPYFGSKYADINIIIDMIKPILNDEGILFMQPLSNVDGKPAITTILMHGAESITRTAVFPDLPKPKEGKKSNPAQEMGIIITYYRRYALVSVLGLEAIDTDGNNNAQQAAPRQQPEIGTTNPGGSSKEIPTCSICGKEMSPQKNKTDKWFCRHEDNGVVKWGKEVWKP